MRQNVDHRYFWDSVWSVLLPFGWHHAIAICHEAGWKTTSLWPHSQKCSPCANKSTWRKGLRRKRCFSCRWNQCGYTWTTDCRQKNQINWSFLRNFLLSLRNLNIYIHLQCLQSTWPFSCASTKAWEPWIPWWLDDLEGWLQTWGHAC